MCKKLVGLLLAVIISSLSHAFTDSVWIVGAQGHPGDLVPVEVWLQYEGGGAGDSMSAFDIPLAYDATVCTAEAITIGPDFIWSWTDESRIDNEGTQGPPALPKVNVGAFTLCPPFCYLVIPRGTHLAGTIDFRILSTVAPPDSACIDTLREAFTPPIYLGLVEKYGYTTYRPSFSTSCIRVLPCTCGDCNGDGRITVADATYLVSYIYRIGPGMVCECDVNLDGRVTVADATYLVAHIYRGGPPPCEPSSGMSRVIGKNCTAN